MPITRTPMVDDDGSGQSGTVINNPWKTELYDQIDAALVGGAAGQVAASFRTAKGSVSAPYNVATTLFAHAGGACALHIVAASLNVGDPANYAAYAFVAIDGNVGRLVAGNAAIMTFSLSGNNVQITQLSGATQIVYWVQLRIF